MAREVVIAKPGMFFEHMDHPGSLYMIESVKPTAPPSRAKAVTFLCIVPAYYFHSPGQRHTLRVDGGNVGGLAWVLLPGS